MRRIAAAVLVLAGCGGAGAATAPVVTPATADPVATADRVATTDAVATTAPETVSPSGVSPSTVPVSSGPTTTDRPVKTTMLPPPSVPATTVPATTPAPLRTACREVVEIGDSTGLLLDTLGDHMRSVGVDTLHTDNSGARSMVERIGEQLNAVEVAESVRAGGFRGCWVILIGTNDAANVAAGAPTDLDTRIARLMTVIDGDPVLWVNVASQSGETYYSSADMQAFNDALGRATWVHPNLQVYDWATDVRPEWFAGDGLHYAPDGRVWRAALIAQALARAFPA